MSNKVIEGFPLSPQQSHLWLLQQEDDERAYRAQCVIEIEGLLDARVLETALQRVIGRHEILRTAFQRLPGMLLPLQVIGSDSLPRLQQHDLSHLQSSEQGAHIQSLQREMSQLPIDLDNGPRLHLWLVKTAPDRHSLLVSLPALCMDSTGLKNLLYEIGSSYAARPSDEELAYEPMQYADFSDWQNELLVAEESADGRAYWQQNNFPGRGALSLPLKKSVAGTSRIDPQVLSTTIDVEALADMEALALRHDVSLSTMLLGCFHLLLWRLTRQAEVTVGMATDGRNYEELETALGLFVRFLPIRALLADELPFDQLIREIEQQVKEARHWQEFFNWEPGGSSDSPANEGGENSTPYLSFNYEFVEDDVQVVPAGDLLFKLARGSAYTSRFDVLLRCLRQADGSLIAEWHYDAHLYERADIERLAAEWKTAVASVRRRDGALLGAVNILDAEERTRLLVDFNRTSQDEVNNLCLHELVEAQAKRTPDAVALEFEGRQLSYRELDARSNRLARYLRRKGVAAEERVAILMERSLELVVGLLGILKAGGAYVPLDAEYPAERLGLMLEDSGARVVVTQERLREVLDGIAAGDKGTGSAAQVVSLDGHAQEIEQETDEQVKSGVSLDNLAYIIFTSGSTGRPKGVMVSHRAICNRLLWIQRAFPMTEADSLLQKTPFSFDASIWEIFVPLFSGARLFIAQPGGHRDSAYLVEEIAKHGITTLQLVPSMLRVVLDEPALSQCKRLRRVFCGGEALPVELQEKFFERMDAELHNLYGPTETAIDATFRTCKAADEQHGILIGRPISNIQVYLLSPELEPVPIGCSGELHVGGIGLARGYLNRPGVTAERFIPDQFSNEAGQRLYRTGDLARYLPDGTIEYLGRLDQQVKLRGFRIELGEIEAALCEQLGVQAAVAVAREDEPGHQRLVAYVVPTNRNSITSSETHLHRLPNQMDINYLNLGEAKLLYDEIFEEQTYLRHGVTLQDGDCVFDLGANIGMFTLFVHQQCRQARVYACEPIPPIFEVLRRNIQLYGLPVKLYQCGISDEMKTAEFTFYPRASATSGMYADTKADEEMTRAYMNNQEEIGNYAEDFLEGRFETERYSCQLKTVSDIIRENALEQVDLLKVDVEKSELDVLNGISDEDWKRIKQFVIEAHDSDGRLESITARLERHGFDFVVEQDQVAKNTGLYNIYAVHPTRRPTASTIAAQNGVNEKPHGGELNPLVSVKELRSALEQRLPDYMVPSAFALLEELPRLPNGKIDRASLPAPDRVQSCSQTTYAAPRSAVEETLTEIWKQVLGLDHIGIHDNFFELGGDSILSIQIVARANQAGLKLSPKLIFRHQSIAELSQVAASSASSSSSALQGIATGEIPLTPIQHSFFEQQLAEPHHFNQAALLEVRRRLAPEQLQQVVEQLVLHHDALRLRFRRDEDGGGWRASYAGAEAARLVTVEEIDLSGIVEAERAAALESRATELQSGLNPAAGPLIRVGLIEMGAHAPQRLLIVIHHLAVDGVSWRILLEDVARGIEQAERGEEVNWGAKTTSYGQWSERLAEYAKGAEVRGELSFWSEAVRVAAELPLPLDYAGAERTLSSSRSIVQRLETDETRALLQEVPAKYHTQINDALLTALVEAIGRWSGQRRLAVEMEGHGREEIYDELDLSRTVGWFTSVYPVVLDLEGVETIGASLKQVKEQLRQIPGGGIGYGVLRYLSDDLQIREQLKGADRVELSFNYLGQLDQVLNPDSLFAGARERSGPQQSERGQQRYALEVSVAVMQGQLQVRCTYNERLHATETIERVLDQYMRALRELVAHCQTAEAGGFTPSDFPLAELNQDELDLALSEIDFS